MKYLLKINDMKYLKLYEAYSNIDNKIGELINWKFIDDVKDMALEYLDDGFLLIVDIYPVLKPSTTIRSAKSRLYSLRYDHNTDDLKFYYYADISKIEDIIYHITLHSHVEADYHSFDLEKTKELIDRISEAYPDENIRSY